MWIITYFWGLTLKMGIQQIDLLIRNKCTKDLSYDQGSCARTIPEDFFNNKLTPPPPPIPIR